MNGGDRIASVLVEQGVRFLFTLCGGHISPILVGAKQRGIRVVDVRHEVDAVFAADAVFRLTGVPGVAAVTAGPGVTNTITAIKNAQLAQSGVVLLGGAAATLLKGRGALQDIDQQALFAPHVKWAASASAVRDLVPMLEKAFAVARAGVPGPVFLECPVDLLYDEALVREWYGASSKGGGLAGAGLRFYMQRHARRLFAGADRNVARPRPVIAPPEPRRGDVRKAAARLRKAKRPVLVLGGQVLLSSPTRTEAEELAKAVAAIGAPVYLAGGARGLLGPGHALQLRHKRREALREADLVLLAGIPSDFRLDYGRHVARNALLISVNRSEADLKMNRKPDLGVHADPGLLLRGLASQLAGKTRDWDGWLQTLRARDDAREQEIDAQAAVAGERVNPVHLCREIDRALATESVIVADGGDFVATAAYTVSPRGPLSWLDPGVFGTLGVGGGFALGAKLCRPEADVWIVYGDGSVAYSLAEVDTFARHGIAVIAIVGNDAGWTQIAREQIEVLHDDVGVVLARTDYHKVAEGYGGRGLLLTRREDVAGVLQQAVSLARQGFPVLVNAHLDKTEFRKGSISM
ncbi:MAG TPA: thiamine pyrophosphate-binding protein [Thermoanaerobaculia bacterium]|jgi:acetolactate synthase-1/2/3 large subunit|nr:thiamine pyrophosphate-binding protein [Thermoanaerobaculia bacterium]